MADNKEDVAQNNDYIEHEESSTSDDSVDGFEPKFCVTECVKLKPREHIAAYFAERELIRDVAPLNCDSDLMEKVMSNYIVAKKILGNLCWQEKLLCKLVCSTWHSAINALAREQITAADFVSDYQKNAVEFRKSESFYNEPLAVLTFTNTAGLNMASPCGQITPCTCTPICEKKSHCWLDVVVQQVSAPKNCMLTVAANYLAYMPQPQSATSALTIPRFDTLLRFSPFICGVHIPKIPCVEFHVLNIRQKNRNTIDMQNDFFEVIDKLALTRIFKGVLVYVTEKYILQTDEVVFLDYLKDVQPGIPYALGGCIVEEALSDQSDINTVIERFNSSTDFVSENLISIGLFTVPKNTDDSDQGECKFDMYSLVIESSEWAKPKIQKAINDFAKKVPQFEHSVALKLSCVGRDQKHAQEQEYFRAAFPRTPLIGCYGNGELGVNHPARPPSDALPRTVKRHRRDLGQQGIIYSYSTVFVYIGWGKTLSATSELVALVAVSCTLFLFLHTRDLSTKLRQMQRLNDDVTAFNHLTDRIPTDRSEHAYATAQEYKEALEAIRRHTGAERSKPQRTLEAEPEESQEDVEQELLDEVLLPEPWELNNTARAGIDLLFFNRVPKVGSQTFMELLRRLAIRNQFGFHRDAVQRVETIRLAPADQQVLVSLVSAHTPPASYIKHVCHTNFTRYGYPNPIYVNVVRDPVERVISWYYYVRAPWYYVERKRAFPDLPLPDPAWLKKDFETCVLSGDRECRYMEGETHEGIGDHRRQTLFFCGHEPQCTPFNSLEALQRAKRVVEEQYAVVGVLEDMNSTLLALERYIPRFFDGASRLYWEELNTFNRINRNAFKPPVSETVKNLVRANFTREIEFYEFCKQRLHMQLRALRDPAVTLPTTRNRIRRAHRRLGRA